ncbi:LOB domain-containing protein 1-like [Juglans microcarpa x Juglans regia]|uniref:LOB domain-containing protein 1-like n=1 Tax=Juglans microcarpa x Juglans regia TaxID=2249226 RepID=UPI001B7F15A8|nr:LOB domain-containing protein 1-like [Juglans microcarpa x Juglans regia]
MEYKGQKTITPPITVPTPFSSSPSSSSISPSQFSPSLSSPSKHSPSFPSPSQSSPPTLPPSPLPNIVLSPCAACKILRRRCGEKCVLAPYFPPTHPLKFTIAHRVFGASNIIKFLQELPEYQRADAVSSMVYEANARIRDPVYGCAGAICQLQNQVSELQAQLAKAQAELVNMQCQQANLVALICMEMSTQPDHQEEYMSVQQLQPYADTSCFSSDDNNLGSAWEPLWT